MLQYQHNKTQLLEGKFGGGEWKKKLILYLKSTVCLGIWMMCHLSGRRECAINKRKQLENEETEPW